MQVKCDYYTKTLQAGKTLLTSTLYKLNDRLSFISFFPRDIQVVEGCLVVEIEECLKVAASSFRLAVAKKGKSENATPPPLNPKN